MTDQAPAPADNAAGQQPAQADQPWYSTIQDESLRGFAELKGWKDPGAAIDSYRSLEKLRGVPENELMRLPKEGDDDAWSQVYSRLGRPETPDAYELPVPDGDDGAFSKAAADWMHKAGLNKSQAQQLAQFNNEYMAEQVKAYNDQVAAQQDRELSELKSEWGMAFDQNTEVARRAAQQFGIDEESMTRLEDALGTKGMMQFLHNIGSKVGEHPFKGGGEDGSFKLSPAAAQERIKQLQGDADFRDRYFKGDVKAKEEMERLHKFAFPG